MKKHITIAMAALFSASASAFAGWGESVPYLNNYYINGKEEDYSIDATGQGDSVYIRAGDATEWPPADAAKTVSLTAKDNQSLTIDQNNNANLTLTVGELAGNNLSLTVSSGQTLTLNKLTGSLSNLTVNGTLALGSNLVSNLTVGGKGTLKLNADSVDNLTVNGSLTLKSGSVDYLTVNGSLSLDSNAMGISNITLDADSSLDGTYNLGQGFTGDVTFTLSDSGVVTAALASGGNYEKQLAGETWNIEKAQNVNLEISGLDYTVGGLILKSNDKYYSLGDSGVALGDEISLDTNTAYVVANVSDSKVTSLTALVTNIPEPSAFGLLAGLGALAFVAARRRRAKKA